jgi:hypothetical protein
MIAWSAAKPLNTAGSSTAAIRRTPRLLGSHWTGA